jgi:hypothetical protein
MTLKTINPKPSRVRAFDEQRIPIRRPDWTLTGEQIVKLHAQGKPVPLTEYTVVLTEEKK